MRAWQQSATPIPAELRASLKWEELTVRSPLRPRWRSRQLSAVACAAAVVLLGTLYGVDEYRDRGRFAAEPDFQSAMARYIASVEFRLDYKTNNLSAILQFLDTHRSISASEIPEALRGRIPKGCKEIAWGQYTVSLICFHEAKPGGRLVHLFMIDKTDLVGAEIAKVTRALRRSSLNTEGWETTTHACVLVAGEHDMTIDHLVGGLSQVEPLNRPT